MSPTMFTIISILLSLICLVVGYFVRKTIAEAKYPAQETWPNKLLRMQSVMRKH